jgi:hypothetical protein
MATKNAPKLAQNPAIAMSEVDAVSVTLNKDNTAYRVTLTMLAGSPEEIKFTPEGEKGEVAYQECGSIELDEPFELGGILVTFKVVKGKKKYQKDRLVIRPVTAREQKGRPSFE